jgi:NAD+ synthase
MRNSIRKSDVYKIIEWAQDWFKENGSHLSTAVVGISGGKDSTVTAALLVEALGASRVFGVIIPNGQQDDIQDARDVCNFLEIDYIELNIEDAYTSISNKLIKSMHGWQTKDMKINLPARLRMATLYAVAQNLPCGGRVVNTCNYSEDYIGYSTRYGDAAGDFGLLSDFTVEEVIYIGRLLGIPERFLVKPPSDGLCGQTDEDKLGFTYQELDEYIETGEYVNFNTKRKIDELHKQNLFKLRPMATYKREKVLRVKDKNIE